MHGIFINYRRDDAAGFARSLYEHLAREFRDGTVFMDVEALREPGIDFAQEIERSLGRCAVVLVLIGEEWLDAATPDGRRRIEEPDDFVRLEIATALKRDIRVIPVLLNRATMPPVDKLPPDLQALGRRQAIVITHDDWMHDVSRLVDSLAKIPGIRRRSQKRSGWSTRSLVIAGTAGGALAIGLFGWLGFRIEGAGDGVPAPTGYDPPAQVTPNAVAPVADTSYSPPVEQQSKASPPVERQVTSYSPPAASRDEVYRAQVLLSSLGYDPGVVDGLQGAATTTAVQAFQRDQGQPVTGTIDADLLQRLQFAYDARLARESSSPPAQVAEQQAAYEPAGTAAYDAGYDDGYDDGYGGGAVANVAGTWYDENGLMAQIIQEGNSLTVGAINPVTGLPQIIGTGLVDGDTITIQYQNFSGIPGVVHAQLAPDGRHLDGTDTNSLLNIPVPNRWHLDHLPGN